MTRIYLVRHGETAFNDSMRIQGQSNIPLNEKGLKQAQEVGLFFKNLNVQAVYSSPLKRAYRTAEEIARWHHLPITTLEDLKEICFGQWEGHTCPEIDEIKPHSWEDFFEHPAYNPIPGGETLPQVQTRVRKALTAALNNYPSGDIVLAAHGGVIKVLICSILGMNLDDIWRVRVLNASTTCFSTYKDKFSLEYTNLHYYLSECKEMKI